MEKMRKVKKLSEGQQLMKLSRDREAKRTYRERRREAGLVEVTVWVTPEQRETVLGWQAANLERVVNGEAVAKDGDGGWGDGVEDDVQAKAKVPRREPEPGEEWE